jgi:hypothetical protein
LNCEQGGGTALIVYNNETGDFWGGISSQFGGRIPVIGISLAYGEKLLQDHLNQQVDVTLEDG